MTSQNMIASAGTYTATGENSTSAHDRLISASQGTYSYTIEYIFVRPPAIKVNLFMIPVIYVDVIYEPLIKRKYRLQRGTPLI